jgi:hypothetical protein
MADQTTTVPLEIDDKELFSGAMADEPRQQAPEPQPEPDGPLRDENGRFAAKTEQEPEPR